MSKGTKNGRQNETGPGKWTGRSGSRPCIRRNGADAGYRVPVRADSDFKPDPSGHREERDERIVLEVHSIRPVREMCGNIRL